MILNICLESPKHKLFNLLFKNYVLKYKIQRKVRKTVRYYRNMKMFRVPCLNCAENMWGFGVQSANHVVQLAQKTKGANIVKGHLGYLYFQKNLLCPTKLI
jgi:hypothetical protein